MKATLDKAWAARLKLRDEGRKPRDEGSKLWEAEVRRMCGDDALIEYDTPGKGDCTVQGVMVFYENQT